MIGVLNIDKPAGITSHDVIDHVRRVAGERRVGHAGTLDPFATGILVVAIGNATRLIEYVHDLPKTYETEFILGATSDTDDVTGKITPTHRSTPPTAETIQAVLRSFVGTIQQLPPAYSAIKVGGKKMYELARAGKPTPQKQRPVTIHSITIDSYAYPSLKLTVTCGSGTYIRSIARDIGTKLGTSGYAKALRRTKIGQFTEKTANTLDSLSPDSISQYLLSPSTLVEHLPSIVLNEFQTHDFQQGKPIQWHENSPAGPHVMYDHQTNLIGIGAFTDGIIAPQKVLTF